MLVGGGGGGRNFAEHHLTSDSLIANEKFLLGKVMAKIHRPTAIFFCAYLATISFAYVSALLEKCTNIEQLVVLCVTWRDSADWIRAFWTYSFEI